MPKMPKTHSVAGFMQYAANLIIKSQDITTTKSKQNADYLVFSTAQWDKFCYDSHYIDAGTETQRA